MPRVSNTFNVSISAAPTSALGTVAAGMAPGTWATLSTINVGPTLYQGPPLSNNMLPYHSKGVWDPVHRLVHIVSTWHTGGQAGQGCVHALYSENASSFAAANTWVKHDHWPNYGQDGGHTYDHMTINEATGDIWMAKYDSEMIVKWPYGGPWQFGAATFPNSSGITKACAMWTGTFAGLPPGHRGMLVIDKYWGANAMLDIDTGVWVHNDQTPPTVASGGYSHVCAYSPVYNCAVYGGGNGYFQSLWRLNADGTWGPLSDVPLAARVGIGSTSINAGTIVADPVTGKFLIFSLDRVWELDPTGSGTYTEQLGLRIPPAAGSGGPNIFNMVQNRNTSVIPIPTYGVIMLVSIDGSNPATGRVHLYKHA